MLTSVPRPRELPSSISSCSLLVGLLATGSGVADREEVADVGLDLGDGDGLGTGSGVAVLEVVAVAGCEAGDGAFSILPW